MPTRAGGHLSAGLRAQGLTVLLLRSEGDTVSLVPAPAALSDLNALGKCRVWATYLAWNKAAA